MGDSSSHSRIADARTALTLSLFTVGYNILEGLASVLFATLDDSTALLGFGADSFVESLSGAVMVWRFWWGQQTREREQCAAKLVGLSCLALAAYVAYEAVAALWWSEGPEPSLAAMVIASLSLVVMPGLFVLKHRTAHAVGSRSLLADSRQTLACTLMSVALLGGAGLNYAFGLWQADPLAALVIASYLVKEGREALLNRELCAC
jgi:divalent metal cation (Fe/Co/Zn/Cd) transporter